MFIQPLGQLPHLVVCYGISFDCEINIAIAAVGMGLMAAGIGVVAIIPTLVGGGAYVTYSWFSSDKDKED
ncbi:MAG: hypothetical protein H6940_11075 [Burkholderiales bacterium]|uniref:hypothetical protein n=1 Tax=Nitrosomonas sp. TaxID=42353 RepID=UPI001DB7D877|nr:hypothetical protein [Nitrosomonas sp.]MCB1948948.1 hypothetical protein [Nitrosomonas sp.]MCP5243951.1 hypothetical protein [Burkholderiales bacterium]